jgi:hypothetical protein
VQGDDDFEGTGSDRGGRARSGQRKKRDPYSLADALAEDEEKRRLGEGEICEFLINL